MVPNSDTCTQITSFLLSSHPGEGNNEQLCISVLVSVENLPREIKQALQAQAQLPDPLSRGLPGLSVKDSEGLLLLSSLHHQHRMHSHVNVY